MRALALNGILLMSALFCLGAQSPSYPAPKLGDTSSYGRNIQRTMRLLATSTPERRNTVRILFYGQSITEQKWAKLVADDLRARFPHADLITENRALGGFASQMLVKTAESDLYPFYPDLLIFQVYGAHNTYEDIIRRTRERTTAEILMQTDHVTKPEHLAEETDPAKLPPAGKHWDAFMNHNWLPMLAKRYGAELCDQRTLWKHYLKDNNLEPRQLLRDSVHLNAHGEFLMAECVKAYLRYDPKLGPSAAEQWVRRHEPGKEGFPASRDGKLRLEFEGNRVDIIAASGRTVRGMALIDGHKPSEIPQLYGFTRSLAKPGGKWPVIAPIESKEPLVMEEWTMDVTTITPASNLYKYTLRGSKTGDDGAGRSDERFVSRSRRVVIETNAWNVSYALGLSGIKPVPERFTVKWSVQPFFRDEFTSPAVDPGMESAVTVAQGLANGKHMLEISSEEAAAIAAVRVYQPPK